MRLRRETGDFSINIDGPGYKKQLPKGLSAEDFAGILITIHSKLTDAETGEVKEDTVNVSVPTNITQDMLAGTIDIAVSPAEKLVYDTATGIITTASPGGNSSTNH